MSAVKGATAALLLALSAAPAASAADFTDGGAVQIRAVLDGMTIALADGRILRLVDIDAPQDGDFAAPAKDALATLVADGRIELRFAGNPRDRQGRVLAEAYVGKTWIQAALLRRGLARVRSSADERAGVADLLAAERRARRYHRGLWADPGYAIRDASEAAGFAGTFQLVGGTIFAATQTSERILLRFGPERRCFLTLEIDRAALKLYRDAGLDPKDLEGKHVRVRGFIDGRLYPTIAITHPEQIEILRVRKKAAPKKSSRPR